MNKIKNLFLLMITIFFIFIITVKVSSLSPKEILEESDAVRQFGVSYSTIVTITTYKLDDIQNIHKYEILAKDNGEKMLVNFIFPKQERGKRILMIDRDMWIFLPDVGKPLKIPSSQRLIGDVAYGDITRINYAKDYNATLIGNEFVKNKKCFVLLLHAKDDSATYGSIKYWVTIENFHPVRAEFYTTMGKLIKIGLFENYKIINGKFHPTKIILIDKLRNSKSVLEYSNVIQKKIPGKFFDKNYLRRLR